MNNFLFMIVFAALIMKQKKLYINIKFIKELLFLINRHREKANMVQNGFQKKAICI